MSKVVLVHTKDSLQGLGIYTASVQADRMVSLNHDRLSMIDGLDIDLVLRCPEGKIRVKCCHATLFDLIIYSCCVSVR
jgi:hypothetical protein